MVSKKSFVEISYNGKKKKKIGVWKNKTKLQ